MAKSERHTHSRMYEALLCFLDPLRRLLTLLLLLLLLSYSHRYVRRADAVPCATPPRIRKVGAVGEDDITVPTTSTAMMDSD